MTAVDTDFDSFIRQQKAKLANERQTLNNKEIQIGISMEENMTKTEHDRPRTYCCARDKNRMVSVEYRQRWNEQHRVEPLNLGDKGRRKWGPLADFGTSKDVDKENYKELWYKLKGKYLEPSSTRKRWGSPVKLSPRGLLDTSALILDVQKEKERAEYEELWRRQHGVDPSPRGPINQVGGGGGRVAPLAVPDTETERTQREKEREDYKRLWEQQHPEARGFRPTKETNMNRGALDTAQIIRELEREKREEEERLRARNPLLGGASNGANHRRNDGRPGAGRGDGPKGVDKDEYRRLWEQQNAKNGEGGKPPPYPPRTKPSQNKKLDTDALIAEITQEKLDEEYKKLWEEKQALEAAKRGVRGEQAVDISSFDDSQRNIAGKIAEAKMEADEYRRRWEAQHNKGGRSDQRPNSEPVDQDALPLGGYEEYRKRLNEERRREYNDMLRQGQVKGRPNKSAPPREPLEEDALPLGSSEENRRRLREERQREYRDMLLKKSMDGRAQRDMLEEENPLPLGAYEENRRKLNEERRREYNDFQKQKKSLEGPSQGQSQRPTPRPSQIPSNTGGLIKDEDRIDRIRKMEEERNQEYNDYLAKKLAQAPEKLDLTDLGLAPEVDESEEFGLFHNLGAADKKIKEEKKDPPNQLNLLGQNIVNKSIRRGYQGRPLQEQTDEYKALALGPNDSDAAKQGPSHCARNPLSETSSYHQEPPCINPPVHPFRVARRMKRQKEVDIKPYTLQKIKERNDEYNMFLANKAEKDQNRFADRKPVEFHCLSQSHSETSANDHILPPISPSGHSFLVAQRLKQQREVDIKPYSSPKDGGVYATIPGLRYSNSAQRREKEAERNREYNDMLRQKAQGRNPPKQGWGTPTYEEMLDKKRAQESQYRRANDIGLEADYHVQDTERRIEELEQDLAVKREALRRKNSFNGILEDPYWLSPRNSSYQYDGMLSRLKDRGLEEDVRSDPSKPNVAHPARAMKNYQDPGKRINLLAQNQQDDTYYSSLPLGGNGQNDQQRRKEEYKRELQRQIAETAYARKAEREQGLLVNNNGIANEPAVVIYEPTRARRKDPAVEAYHTKILSDLNKLDELSPRNNVLGRQQPGVERRNLGGFNLNPGSNQPLGLGRTGGSILDLGFDAALDPPTRLTSMNPPAGLQYQPSTYITANAVPIMNNSVDEAYNFYATRNPLDPDLNVEALSALHYPPHQSQPMINMSHDSISNHRGGQSSPFNDAGGPTVVCSCQCHKTGHANCEPGHHVNCEPLSKNDSGHMAVHAPIGGGGGGGGGGRDVPSLNLNGIGGGDGGPGSRVRFMEPRAKGQDAAATGGMVFATDDERKRGQRQTQLAYREELERQMVEKNIKKMKEKEEQIRYEMKMEQEAKTYDPFGKGGGGAPMRDQFGNVISDLRQMRNDNVNRTERFSPRGYGGGGGSPYDGSGGGGGPQAGNTTRAANSYRDDLIGPPPIQTTAEGETSFARGGHGIFGMPKTEAEKVQADKYKLELKRQIEEKKAEEYRKKQLERLEEEREQKMVEEQRAKMQREYDEEQRKLKEKEDDARRKNEEMMRAAEDKKMEIERRRREAEELRHQDLREERQRERQMAEDSTNRGKSPPIPALRTKQEEGGEITKAPSPPIPATRRREVESHAPSKQEFTPRAQSADVLNQLAQMRAQLQNERLRVQTMLDDQDDDVEIYDPRQAHRPPATTTVPQARPEVDVFETAMNRNAVAVRRTPGGRTSAERANPHLVEEFNALKHKDDSDSRRQFRQMFPNEPMTSDALETQQIALLRQQEERLRNMKDRRALDDTPAPHMNRDTRTSSSQLHSNSAFVDVNGLGSFPDDFEDLPRRNDSARYRRRTRLPSSPKIGTPDIASRATFGSQSSLNVDKLARKNEDRLRRLRELQGDDMSLYDPEDVLDRFMTKQGHNRPPSRNTLLDDTWMRTGSKQSKY